MADTLDVLTLSEAHAVINVADSVTTQDTKLALYVTAVSRRLDDLCGPIVQRTITAETYDGADEEDYDRQMWYAPGDGAFTHNGRPLGPMSPLLGRTAIRLKYRPVMSVTSVTEYAATSATVLTQDTTSALPSAGFAVDLATGILYRRSGGRDWYFPIGRRNVSVTYVAGRAAATASVDSRFKLAASVILNHVWRPQSGAWAQSADPYGNNIPAMPAMSSPGYAIPYEALEWIADDINKDEYLV